ncbi:hypothetical protein MSG28_008867 [Choristoneura fumiferana]|uniref:Uncharacterized protein n=1 Tax=Choristoneura fumiferana TaxID=7141 RepID=A0ACC0J8I9_CHOFU|nr:hypothetical protein MSG28_008867 [Choristoneura fumiferana]
MKVIFVAIAVTFFAIAMAQDEKYTDKYDYLNIDEMLGNKRLITAYIKCVLEKGKCTPEGRELKAHIVDALQNGCAKCTSAQREGMRKVIHYLIHEETDSWRQLVDKYDPKKIYTRKYEQQLNSVMKE